MLTMTFGVFGQSRIGIFTGLNSGKLSGDSPGKFKYSSGLSFAFGIGYDLQLKEDVFLSFQPSYVNASSKLKHPKLIVEEEEEEEILADSVSFDFQQFALPILMKLISDNKKFQFMGGFEFIFPLKMVADNTEEEIDLIDNISKVNLNMIFGIGYRIPVKRSLIDINLIYSQALTNLANNLEDPNSLLPRIRYSSFRITAGWHLPVGKNRFQKSSN